MAGFIDVNDYFDFYGEVPAAPMAVQLAIDAACDLVRQHTCQTIDVVANDVVTLHGTDTRALLLPELPVTAVDSVTLDGVAVTDFTLDAYGLLWRDAPGWWPRGEQYVVTYDHGFAVIPSDIKLVTLQLARSLATGDAGGGIRSETVAGYSVTYSEDSGPAAVLQALDHRRLRKVPTA